jgi:hypothetical protein
VGIAYGNGDGIFVRIPQELDVDAVAPRQASSRREVVKTSRGTLASSSSDRGRPRVVERGRCATR